MVHALQTEGESITKLEKADVLELTVRHLQKLKRQQLLTLNPHLEHDRYHAGYTACATEVSRCLNTIPGVDITITTRMMSHLGQKLTILDTSRVSPLTVRVLKSPSIDTKSPSGILDKDPRCMFLLTGTVFANICCKLIIAQMSNTRSELFSVILIPLAITVALVVALPGVTASMELAVLYGLTGLTQFS